MAPGCDILLRMIGVQVLIITKAQLNDADGLAVLAKKSFCDTFGHLYTNEDLEYYLYHKCSQKFFADCLAGDSSILMACEGKKIIGYVKYGSVEMPFPKPISTTRELHRIYVDKDYLSKGCGAALMMAALDSPEMKDAASIVLGVWEKNFRAQNFYKRYGFKVVGEYDFYVGKHADREFIMERVNFLS
jgi:ribosomal protein S18 acetylase RimI-like enzyme